MKKSVITLSNIHHSLNYYVNHTIKKLKMNSVLLLSFKLNKIVYKHLVFLKMPLNKRI